MTIRPGVLTNEQQIVADRVLSEEGAKRKHIVVALSGAHAYGFPSPDSDLDLKAIHVDPTARVLSLGRPEGAAGRVEMIEGVEIDYTSNEIQGVLLGILAGNGNYAERVLGKLILEDSPVNESLRPLVQRAFSRRIHHHYRGFAMNQLKDLESRPVVTAKKVLYVLRTALTGAHVLLTGELVPDLGAIAAGYGFARSQALIDAKRAGERCPLPEGDVVRWRGELLRALDVLEDARGRSILPDEAPNKAEFETWLIDLRRANF